VATQRHDVELLAEAGALLLLFSVGIEFSLAELARLWRHFLVGGSVQMTLVAVPAALAARALGWSWSAAVLAGAATALSSTVLVFRALHEVGQVGSAHGRRGLGILLFQDVALVPLLLLLPLLKGDGESIPLARLAVLGMSTLLFVGGVALAKRLVQDAIVPWLARLRSVETVVLFAVVMIGGGGWVAAQLELPPAVGSLAAGLVLSDNRLSHQIESILLPFRETFAAVFFVTLGMLLKPFSFFDEPVLLTSAIVGVLALKTVAAAVALRLTHLAWPRAWGMGLGLSQLGEFSFLLMGKGLIYGVIEPDDYNRILFIAIATLVLTPSLLRRGLTFAAGKEHDLAAPEAHVDLAEAPALVIGIGPIGRQVTSRLELLGLDVCLLDLSPINLQPFAQLGFRTCVGDARDQAVLERVGVQRSRLAVVCVPNDDIALAIVRTLRAASRELKVIVRCRLLAKVRDLERAGADGVISEEAEASGPLIEMCERWLQQPTAGASAAGR